ncbi:hypothetical protein LTR41_012145 [Exophiala xenobiotica]|nr:hypothetical protein LTR41_012145 [Exophiala xenobiotica]
MGSEPGYTRPLLICHLSSSATSSDPVPRFPESPVEDARGGGRIDFDIHNDWQQTLTPTPPLTHASSPQDPEDAGSVCHDPDLNLEHAARKLFRRSRQLRKTGQRARKQSVGEFHHMIRRSHTRIKTFYQLIRRDEKEVVSRTPRRSSKRAS